MPLAECCALNDVYIFYYFDVTLYYTANIIISYYKSFHIFEKKVALHMVHFISFYNVLLLFDCGEDIKKTSLHLQ